jgi:hypothetical protein
MFWRLVLWLAPIVLIGGILVSKLSSQAASPHVPSGPKVAVRILQAGAVSAEPALAPQNAGVFASALSSVAAPVEARDKAPLAPNSAAKTDDTRQDLLPALVSAKAGPKGGVPIHEKGVYRSPFANPDVELSSVRVGFLLQDLTGYDIKNGSFQAEFYLSLSSDLPMPSIDLDFTNGKVDDKEVQADLPTFKLFHFVGTFESIPDLHDYPFDTQQLSIELEDNENGTDQLRLVPDRNHTKLDVGFQVAGWEISSVGARVIDRYFPDRFDDDDLYYSRYRFTLGLKRFGTTALFTVFVPAFVIVLISLSGLWLPREELEVRSNATTPMLAAAVLFHFALMSSLPATGYLTRADKLMLAVYACLALHMGLMWLWFVFDERYTDVIHLIGKRLGPPLTLLIMALGVLW